MSKRQKEIFGLSLIIFSILSIISLIGHDITESPNGLPENYQTNNYLGYFGIWVSHFHYILLGYTSIIFPVIFICFGYFLFTNKNIKNSLPLISYVSLFGLFFSIFMSLLANLSDKLILNNYFSGVIGYTFFTFLNDFLGIIGSSTVIILCFVLLITYMLKISIYELFNKSYVFFKNIFKYLYSILKTTFKFFVKLIKKKKVS